MFGIVLGILGLPTALSYVPIRIRLEAALDLHGGQMQVYCRYLLHR